MTRQELMTALDAYTDAERLAFLESYQERFCSDCGGLIAECGCYRCVHCGHCDKLRCPCAKRRREAANERAKARTEAAQAAFAAIIDRRNELVRRHA